MPRVMIRTPDRKTALLELDDDATVEDLYRLAYKEFAYRKLETKLSIPHGLITVPEADALVDASATLADLGISDGDRLVFIDKDLHDKDAEFYREMQEKYYLAALRSVESVKLAMRGDYVAPKVTVSAFGGQVVELNVDMDVTVETLYRLAYASIDLPNWPHRLTAPSGSTLGTADATLADMGFRKGCSLSFVVARSSGADIEFFQKMYQKYSPAGLKRQMSAMLVFSDLVLNFCGYKTDGELKAHWPGIKAWLKGSQAKYREMAEGLRIVLTTEQQRELGKIISMLEPFQYGEAVVLEHFKCYGIRDRLMKLHADLVKNNADYAHLSRYVPNDEVSPAVMPSAIEEADLFEAEADEEEEEEKEEKDEEGVYAHVEQPAGADQPVSVNPIDLLRDSLIRLDALCSRLSGQSGKLGRASMLLASFREERWQSLYDLPEEVMNDLNVAFLKSSGMKEKVMRVFLCADKVGGDGVRMTSKERRGFCKEVRRITALPLDEVPAELDQFVQEQEALLFSAETSSDHRYSGGGGGK